MSKENNNQVNSSFKIKNFRSVGDEPVGFDRIMPINLIIGKNNSGKSTIIDLIHSLTNNGLEFKSHQYHNGKKTSVEIGTEIQLDAARKAYARPINIKGIPNTTAFTKELSGKTIIYTVGKDSFHFERIEGFKVPPTSHQDLTKIADQYNNPLSEKLFQKIASERNILPEKGDFSSTINCDEFGNGATNIVQRYLNDQKFDERIINSEFLDSLNAIFNPDYKFDTIMCQTNDGGKWEIYLVHNNTRISLSESGSGLKTIFLVLIQLVLIPKALNKDLSHFVFAFEELENNLHPSLFRNLITFIQQKIKDTSLVFITTHSHIAIDLFAKDDNAQILHVINENSVTKSFNVITHIDSNNILDDLEIKASDLLQSNAIIWVEGPSDRVYINKWISLLSDDIYQGAHYQIIFYGGALRSHLSIEEPELVDELISVLSVNRNAYMVMDSDKGSSKQSLNSTKKRIISESEEMGVKTWVTDGREIENYLTKRVLNETYKTKLQREIGTYAKINSYLNSASSKLGDRYSRNKYKESQRIAKNLAHEDISENKDLKNQILSIISFIKEKNYIS